MNHDHERLMTVWKWRFTVADVVDLPMPAGAQVLHVGAHPTCQPSYRSGWLTCWPQPGQSGPLPLASGESAPPLTRNVGE